MRVADLHCDTALELSGGADLASHPGGHVDLPRLRAGGVGLQVFAAFVPGSVPPDRAHGTAMDLLDRVDRAVEALPELAACESAAEVRQAWDRGRIAAVRAVESGAALESDPSLLEVFRRRGVRYLTLVHGRHLDWITSSGPADDGGRGLSRLGVRIVAAMEDAGILVDVSHASPRAFWDVVRVARRPFLASHSCAAALCPHPRNLDDDQLRAVGDAGGVVGVAWHPAFLERTFWEAEGARCADVYARWLEVERAHRGDPRSWHQANREVGPVYRERMEDLRPPLSVVLDHLERVAEVAGDHAVAIGTDLDGVPALPAGVSGCDAMVELVDGLRERGWSEDRLEGLAWRNALRILG